MKTKTSESQEKEARKELQATISQNLRASIQTFKVDSKKIDEAIKEASKLVSKAVMKSLKESTKKQEKKAPSPKTSTRKVTASKAKVTSPVKTVPQKTNQKSAGTKAKKV